MQFTNPHSFKWMIGRMVRIHCAGISHRGRLLAVKDDYLVLLSNDQHLYFQTHQVKSIAVDSIHNLPLYTPTNPFSSYMDADKFSDLLRKMIYRAVRINQNGPESMRGILAKLFHDHVDLVSGYELISVSIPHIKSICHDINKNQSEATVASSNDTERQSSKTDTETIASKDDEAESVKDTFTSTDLLPAPEVQPSPPIVEVFDPVTPAPLQTTTNPKTVPMQRTVPEPISIPAKITLPPLNTLPFLIPMLPQEKIAEQQPTPMQTTEQEPDVIPLPEENKTDSTNTLGSQDYNFRSTNVPARSKSVNPTKKPSWRKPKATAKKIVSKFSSFQKSSRSLSVNRKNKVRKNQPTVTKKRQWSTVTTRRNKTMNCFTSKKVITNHWHFPNKNRLTMIWLSPVIRCGYRKSEGRASK
ncbi:hypothetical protein [Brevibacillus nitrificans]|uniref:hypothetical protein n=1 Tax=Brevibacillus nitrificans TaxID=651560 RepID=UPI002855FBF9|nr:hypothetical protein [Brevibacillus nitrificans]MDR7314668.1 hypothetical protein [Brevibacillus nitrificans]